MKTALLFFAGCLAAGCSASGPDGPLAGRNVVVITMDTTRFDHLGFNGYPKDTTPFLDSLAADAVLFDGAYATSSWTAPSTASIFTGLYPNQHGITAGYFFYQRASSQDAEVHLNKIPAAVQTLPEMMRAAGYRTYGAADNLNICERVGFTRGFDRFETWVYEGGARMNAQLDEWRDELVDGDRPFFLYLQYMDPHKPYHLQEPYYQLEGTVAAQYVKPAARYDSEIAYLDSLIRDIYAKLELDENTLLILTADHGEEFGDHGGQGHENSLHEELTHVPLVFLGRDAAGKLDFEPGRVFGRVSNLDILPTLADLIGVPIPEYVEGRSLVPILEGQREELSGEERSVFGHRRTVIRDVKREWYSINQGPWQLIHNTVTGDRKLYTFKGTPPVEVDMTFSRPRIFERLAAELDRFRERPILFEPEFAEPVVLDEEAQSELGRLGYAA